MCTPEREPCPDRILDDIGGAFGMGAVGGTAFHFLKGVYNSPKSEHFIGGTQAVRMNAPRLSGSFAILGGLFSILDCTMVYVRQKEYPWNSIIAGAAAGGFLSLRQGAGPAVRSTVFGGVLLGLIEGAGIMLNKFMPVLQQSMIMLEDDAQANQAGFQNSASEMTNEGSGSSGWFGRLFGEKKEEVKVKTEVFESFDSPMPPTFEFK
nr:mitochondrial import inner membrane translocase subunit TIM17-2-like [Tanacetum cinerariifolium]